MMNTYWQGRAQTGGASQSPQSPTPASVEFQVPKCGPRGVHQDPCAPQPAQGECDWSGFSSQVYAVGPQCTGLVSQGGFGGVSSFQGVPAGSPYGGMPTQFLFTPGGHFGNTQSHSVTGHQSVGYAQRGTPGDVAGAKGRDPTQEQETAVWQAGNRALRYSRFLSQSTRSRNGGEERRQSHSTQERQGRGSATPRGESSHGQRERTPRHSSRLRRHGNTVGATGLKMRGSVEIGVL